MALRDNPGAAISGGAHFILLAAVVVSFSHAAKFDDAAETVPVSVLTTSEFNQIMKGEKTAQLRDRPQLKVGKLAALAETKPPSIAPEAKTDIEAPQTRAAHNDDPGLAETKPPAPPARPVEAQKPPEVAKPEPVKPEPPKPEPQKPEPQKAEKPQPPKPVAAVKPPDSADAVEPKPAPRPKPEPKKLAEPKPKPVEQTKPEPKFRPDELAKLLEQDKTKDPPPKPAPKQKSGDERADPADKFDLSDISRFLNKDAPQRKPATGAALQQVASLGAPTASAAKMAPSMWAQLDGLMQDQYRHCWNYIGMAGQEKYVPQIHVQYAQDGGLIGQPELMNPPSDPNLRSLAESAMRAVRRCNPMRIPAIYQPYYDQWKGRIVRFDPEDML